MKKILELYRNFSFLLGLSLILLSCETQQNVVLPGSSETEELTAPSTENPTEETTEESSVHLLDVEVDFSFEDCSCSGNFQKAKIILSIKNGEPPFNISDQEPVNDRLVTFPVPLGGSFPLTITSFDGLIWETNKIEVPLQSSCQPLKNACGGDNGGGDNGGGDNGGGCTEKEVQVCEDIVSIINVCTKWTGNHKKCLESEPQEIVNEVCVSEVVCE